MSILGEILLQTMRQVIYKQLRYEWHQEVPSGTHRTLQMRPVSQTISSHCKAPKVGEGGLTLDYQSFLFPKKGIKKQNNPQIIIS